MIKIVKIPLTQGRVAIIDAEDAPRVLQHKWCATKEKNGRRWYAVRSFRRNGKHKTTISLHRFILDTPADIDIDHADCNGLNNRRSNLRLATRTQNNQNARISLKNTSGFKGVSWDKRNHKWKAYIGFNGCLKHLGNFQTKEEAAVAYDQTAIKLFGKFARPNGVQLEFPFIETGRRESPAR
jgi:hypothetical protein